MNTSTENILAMIGAIIGIMVYSFVRWQYRNKWKEQWSSIALAIGFAPATVMIFFPGFSLISALLGGFGGGIFLAGWLSPKVIRRIEEQNSKEEFFESDNLDKKANQSKIDQKTGRKSLRR